MVARFREGRHIVPDPTGCKLALVAYRCGILHRNMEKWDEPPAAEFLRSLPNRKRG